MSGREGGKKKPLKAPKKEGKCRRNREIINEIVTMMRNVSCLFYDYVAGKDLDDEDMGNNNFSFLYIGTLDLIQCFPHSSFQGKTKRGTKSHGPSQTKGCTERSACQWWNQEIRKKIASCLHSNASIQSCNSFM